ncbi:MAG: glucose-1-phosphate thymidylyltransferase [bacterium TMED217]|nr:MAG: glucose-1-phosphate thymidylyltransferase [bacterium TMED217]
MKGIILAGGTASRLHPTSVSVNKHLLPVYDKPMIYYPLSTMMLAGVKDILIITSGNSIDSFRMLLGNGSHLGIKISYAVQDKPNGIGEAFLIGEQFINNEPVCLILGDNIFHGTDLQKKLHQAAMNNNLHDGATIFAYKVLDPRRFGVVEFDSNNIAISLEEKPENPKSNFMIPGLYFYDNQIVNIAKKMKPSDRNELEITDINNYYFSKKILKVTELGRGTAWFDCGTEDSLLSASNFVQILEKKQGLKIGCIEEISLNEGLISKSELKIYLKEKNSNYYNYLKSFI